jgi:hypothetical protein
MMELILGARNKKEIANMQNAFTRIGIVHINERRNPIVITQNGEARAVLVDIETYQETQDAFALLTLIKIAEKDVQDGNTEPSM